LLLEDDELVGWEQCEAAVIEGGGVGLGCWSVSFVLGWGQLGGCQGLVGELITTDELELIRADETGVGVFV